MLAYPILLFDFGGTLANIHPRHEWLYVRACQEFGVHLAPEKAHGIVDFGWEDYDTPLGPVHLDMSASEDAFAQYKTTVIADRLKRMGVEGPLEKIAARVYELDTEPDMYRLYDDVLPTLDALKPKGYKMGIISNHEWGLPDLITGLGLDPYFDTVVSSARVGYRKPHPEIFRFTLDGLGGSADQALMIGDSISSDVRGAIRMGMSVVLVDRDNTSTPVDGVPVVDKLSDLLEFL